MRMPISSLIVVLAMTGAVETGAASPLPESGTRIRLTARTPKRERWIGPFVAVAQDTVRMQDGGPEGALVAVPALHVERFEVSRGVQPRLWRGALVGLLIGSALGAAGGYFLAEANDFEGGPGAAAVGGAVVLGALGAAIGASNEARSPSEQWRELPLTDLRTPAGR